MIIKFPDSTNIVLLTDEQNTVKWLSSCCMQCTPGLLSLLFENELLNLIKRLRESLKMYDVNITCPAFADDVSFFNNKKSHECHV